MEVSNYTVKKVLDKRLRVCIKYRESSNSKADLCEEEEKKTLRSKVYLNLDSRIYIESINRFS